MHAALCTSYAIGRGEFARPELYGGVSWGRRGRISCGHDGRDGCSRRGRMRTVEEMLGFCVDGDAV